MSVPMFRARGKGSGFIGGGVGISSSGRIGLVFE